MPDTRPFWSGTIAFGLVSLPVSMFTANRSSQIRLRMLDEDGTPLARRYFCSKEKKILTRDELVRGYEIEKGKYIEVSDDELDALEPEKSREIDLRRFVPLDTLDPMFFERAYFLIPDEGAIKAYRLLAHTMQETSRAGVATVVMRGKEYLVAILAEDGILRAETMRFSDELRSPSDMGLAEPEKVDSKLVKSLSSQIKKLSEKDISRKELADTASQRMMKLIKRKLKSGKDVIQDAGEQSEDQSEEEDNVIDLMEVLKKRLKSEGDGDGDKK